MKIKPSRNSEITLSFNAIGKSCPSREYLTSQICIFRLFAKISEFTGAYILMKILNKVPLLLWVGQVKGATKIILFLALSVSL